MRPFAPPAIKASVDELASVTCARPERNTTHLFILMSGWVNVSEWWKGGRERDVLLSWRIVEAGVESGWDHGVTHVGEVAQLEDARADRARL